MSYKLSALQYATVPATTCKFSVLMDNLEGMSLLRCEAAEFHNPEVVTNSMTFSGQTITLPTNKIKVPGTLSLIFQEDWAFSTYRCLMAMYPHFNNSIKPHTNPEMSNITVMLAPTYGGSALEAFASLNNRFGSCFIRAIQPVKVDWSKPTEMLKWQVTFQYNTLETKDNIGLLAKAAINKSNKVKAFTDKLSATALAQLEIAATSAVYLSVAEINSCLGAVGRALTSVASI